MANVVDGNVNLYGKQVVSLGNVPLCVRAPRLSVKQESSRPHQDIYVLF